MSFDDPFHTFGRDSRWLQILGGQLLEIPKSLLVELRGRKEKMKRNFVLHYLAKSVAIKLRDGHLMQSRFHKESDDTVRLQSQCNRGCYTVTGILLLPWLELDGQPYLHGSQSHAQISKKDVKRTQKILKVNCRTFIE